MRCEQAAPLALTCSAFELALNASTFMRHAWKLSNMKFTLKVDGYSLIEMLFMLFIVGVLCSTVALSFKGLQNRVHIQAASRSLAERCS